MLDDILDLFMSRKRRSQANRTTTTTGPDLPFELPFLDAEDDRPEPNRRPRQGDRDAQRHHTARRPVREDDSF